MAASSKRYRTRPFQGRNVGSIPAAVTNGEVILIGKEAVC